MGSWIWKGLAALVIWVIAALLVAFVGNILGTVDSAQIKTLGEFLEAKAGLIGFLFGAVYFLWGPAPIWNRNR